MKPTPRILPWHEVAADALIARQFSSISQPTKEEYAVFLAKLDTHSETEELAAAKLEITELTEQRNRLQRLASFFRAVIKSGESWSTDCEREYDRAMGD